MQECCASFAVRTSKNVHYLAVMYVCTYYCITGEAPEDVQCRLESMVCYSNRVMISKFLSK